MNDNPSTVKKAARGNPLRRFATSLRFQFSATTILMAVVPLVIVATALGTLVSNQVRTAMTENAFSQLEAVSTLKIQHLQGWFADRMGEAFFLANTGAVKGKEGATGISVLSEYKSDISNPAYQLASKQAQGMLSSFTEQIAGSAYDDIMLIDLEGDVVFAVDPECLGTNEAESAAFQNGLQAPYVGDMVYVPDHGEYALRIAVPVINSDEKTIGVLVLEIGTGALTDIMQERTGLGQTGETYLVGPDKLFRNDSRFLEQLGVETTILNPDVPVDTVASRGGLAGEPGTQIIDNYRGIRTLSSWSTVILQEPTAANPNGVAWAVIAEIDESEALAAVNSTTAFITTLSLVLLGMMTVVAALVGSLIAGRLAKPIVGLTDSAEAIASGDLDVVIPPTRSKSEVGVLTNAFATMTTRLQETVGSLRETTENLAERTRELEASQRVTFAASERSSPDELLGLVVDLVRDQFDLYHAQVYIVDEEQEAAVLRQSTGYAGSQLLQQGHQIPLDATALVTRAIHTGSPVLVADVNQAEDWLPNPLLPETQSELVVPLKAGDHVIGVLDAQDIIPGRFSESTVALFQAMADQVAFLFENSDLLERVTEQSETLTVFTTQLRTASEIARQAGGVLDPEQLLQQVVELMQSRFGLYHAHIYVLDEATAQLTIHAGSGEVGRVLREEGHAIPLDREKSLVARAAREQKPVLVKDTTLESDFMPNPLLPQTRSELSVPLVAGGRVLGVLDMQDDQAGRFSESDVDTFTTLAGQIAIALQNASLFEQVQEAAEQVRDADRRKSEFLADMSHELRTPLNSIIGYTELMLMGVSDMDPDTLEDVQAIYDNGQHLLRIINDILDLAKIEAGRMELDMEKVHVPSLLEDVKTSNAGLLINKPVEMLVEAEKDLPPIEADRVRLSQILNNLIGNAIKFTEEGSITMQAFGKKDGWAYIEVKDTGAGMNEDDLQAIFERFRRVGSSLTRRTEGTGLGLDITRHLVALHGGTIDVRSQLGEGSTFTVRLPFKQPVTVA